MTTVIENDRFMFHPYSNETTKQGAHGCNASCNNNEVLSLKRLAKLVLVRNGQCNKHETASFQGAAPFEKVISYSEPDTFPERAALIEANGVPRAWAEGFASLDQGQTPENVPARRWRLFIDDCGRFLDGGLAKQAAALGWGPLNLFGCDRDSPLVRLDHAGLLWLTEGRKLVELSRIQASIECADGNRLSFYRRPAAVGQVVLAWDLAD